MSGYVPFFWMTVSGDEDDDPCAVALEVGKRTEEQALAWAIRETRALGYDEPRVTFRRRAFYRLANEIECRCRGIRTYGDGAWVEARRMPHKTGGEFYLFDVEPFPATTQEGDK